MGNSGSAEKVNAPEESPTVTVEGVAWKLSGKLYQIVYPIGAILFGKYSSARNAILNGEQPDLPKRIIHTGIVIHGHLYEYSTEGVRKTKATPDGDPGSTCAVDEFLDRKLLGTSTVSLWDFDCWVADQKKGRFLDHKYSVVDNQCCHFAIETCKFLEIDPPTEWEQMCRFTERNQGIVRFADGFTRFSASTASTS